jgi:cell division protein FtsA
MTAKDFIVAIEIGSSRVTGIAGKKNSDGSLQIYAYAREEAASYVRRGVIYNIDKMAMSLTSIINKLEGDLNASIAKVYVGIGGQSLRSKLNTVTRQWEEETKLQKEQIDEIMESNLKVEYPGLDILDVVPQEYLVKNNLIYDPIGMMSDRIEGHFLNIVARSSIRPNLLTSFKQANIDIAALVVSPIALADVVLTETEKRAGCALVDFGAETTTVAVYKGNVLRHLVVIPLGGANLTKDICSLQIEEADAEQLKMKYGYAYTRPEEKDPEGKVYTVENGNVSVSARNLNELIEARMEEILLNVKNQVELSGYQDRLNAGYVLTGGGSNIKRLADAFNQKLKIDKLRIASYVLNEVKATKSELLIHNGVLNTTFGLLAAGQENCCEVEPPHSLFDEEESRLAQEEADRQREAEEAAAKAEAEAIRLREEEESNRLLEENRKSREEDAFWEQCVANGTYKQYLDTYGKEGKYYELANDRYLEEQVTKKPRKPSGGGFGKILSGIKDKIISATDGLINGEDEDEGRMK